MAITTNTAVTYGGNHGQREDLTDVIYNISPTDTPFMNRIGKGTATAVLHEWQTDSLDAADSDNAALEGDEAAFTAQTATTRQSNRCQISTKSVIISGTLETVLKAGRKSEVAYQVAKRMKELKRDMETILTGNQAALTGNATTARKLRSLESWYSSNVNAGTGGENGTVSTARTDGTSRAFTESMLKDVLQKCWTSGGEPDFVMVGPKNKVVISGFSGNATRMDTSEDKRLVASIDYYVSDFGEVEIVPNRFSRDCSAHVIQSDMWSVSYLRPISMADLAKTGDAEKKLIIAEYTLEARNEASSGLIADLQAA